MAVLVIALWILAGFTVAGILALVLGALKTRFDRTIDDAFDQLAHGDHPFVPKINTPRGD